jgi:uncharacterized protein
MRIIDTDVHIHDDPQAWASYCDMPWRKAIEHSDEIMGGLSLGPRLDPIFPGGIARRDVFTAAQMRTELDQLGIDIGVLFPNYLLTLSMLPNSRFAAALARAYNAWLLENWLRTDIGLKGAIAIAPQDPADAARQIERYAPERNVVAAFLPCAGLHPYYGDCSYDPIYAAAQSLGLPLILHSVSVIHPVFPFNLNEFDTAVARHTLAHPVSIFANLISMITAGVPERFPGLKIAFSEAGISWVPFLMWRLDKEYIQHRSEMPYLRDKPSTYIRRFYFCTQPIEEPERPDQLVDLMRMFGGEDNVMFASDWPHPDFDHPSKVLRLPLSLENKKKIMSENAARFLNLGKE